MLVCRAGTRSCAIRLEDVREVLRPLALQTISGGPPFVIGAALLRGQVTPVVDVGAIFGETASARRWVALRIGQRRVALAFSEVVGVRSIPLSEPLPDLLQGASPGVVEALTVLDSGLLSVLAGARLVPDVLPEPAS